MRLANQDWDLSLMEGITVIFLSFYYEYLNKQIHYCPVKVDKLVFEIIEL